MTARPRARDDRRCRQLLQELFAYLDDELAVERCRALERHLDTCHCCDTLAGNLRKAIALCRLEGAQRLPAPVRAGARRRVRALLDDAVPSAGGAAARPGATSAGTARGARKPRT